MQGWVRLILFLALLGSTTYAVSLAASVPASLVASQVELPEQIIDVSGTIWNGQAILRGGYELKWQVLPFWSLFHLAFDADWTLTGVDTRLNGRASLWTRSAVTSVDGRAGWGLARMAFPGTTIACDGSLALALSRVAIANDRQGAVGSLRSGPSVCTGIVTEAAIEVPALTGTATMDAEGSRLSVAATAVPGVPLADLRIAARVLSATLHPEGSRLTGALPTSGPITVEYPF
ncbi:MAG: type II secretion system protein N [Rhizobiaceae bacterium]|nr:type II secretion system protein N [Rhizobiaceae bacterium]